MTTPSLALISDTHGHEEFTRPALTLLSAFHPQALIHAGDLGGPEMIRLFPTEVPCHFVRGNCDERLETLAEAVRDAGQTWWGEWGAIEIAGRSVAFLHGDDSVRLQQLIQSQTYDLVIHGHTHRAQVERRGTTWVVNPGAVYRARPHTVAVVALDSLEVQILPVR